MAYCVFSCRTVAKGADQRRNEQWEKFYSEIVPAEEWEAFFASMRDDLPIVFRAIPSSMFYRFVNDEIVRQFPDGRPVVVGDEEVMPPRKLDWYPGGTVWEFKASRKDTRNEPRLASFKQWLIGAAESGQVVRQEVVR